MTVGRRFRRSPFGRRARRVPRPLVLLLVALAAILVSAALGTVSALGAPAFGAQNRAGDSNPATHIHTQGQSVRNPCSRRDPNAQNGRIAAGYFVGDEDAAALDEGEDVATEAAESSQPLPAPNFEPPTNAPQPPLDPADVPPGWRVRVMQPTDQYPDGYWRLEKPMTQGGWQGIDPSTMKPGGQPETHIPLPPTN